ncbi:MAG TPA: hypothetical protein VES88_06760 [Gemmatimonadaceae bacterium]|nr:hypothetical protein [Gemmatimonadaceae bacterium]
MTSPKFSYAIEVEEIDPPAGQFTHAATIVQLTREDADGAIAELPAPFPEVWGEDRSEAARKARVRIDAWIATQGPNYPKGSA